MIRKLESTKIKQKQQQQQNNNNKTTQSKSYRIEFIVVSEELVKASNTSNFYVQDFSVRYNGKHADICFDGEDNISVTGKTIDSNRFNIALNDNPI